MKPNKVDVIFIVGVISLPLTQDISSFYYVATFLMTFSTAREVSASQTLDKNNVIYGESGMY